MKTAEIRERTTGDLEMLVKELRETLWKSKFQNYTNQLDDTARIPRARRDIARVLGILRERELKGTEAQPGAAATAAAPAEAAKRTRKAPAKKAEASEAGATEDKPKKARKTKTAKSAE